MLNKSTHLRKKSQHLFGNTDNRKNICLYLVFNYLIDRLKQTNTNSRFKSFKPKIQAKFPASIIYIHPLNGKNCSAKEKHYKKFGNI